VSEPQILHFERLKAIQRGGGVITKPLAGEWIGTEHFTSGITTFPPGAGMMLHTHNVEEAVTILEGDAEVEVGGEICRLKRLDTTFAPVGTPHRFTNVGDGPMSILWVYATTHVTRTIVETGETAEHLSPADMSVAS